MNTWLVVFSLYMNNGESCQHPMTLDAPDLATAERAARHMARHRRENFEEMFGNWHWVFEEGSIEVHTMMLLEEPLRDAVIELQFIDMWAAAVNDGQLAITEALNGSPWQPGW